MNRNDQSQRGDRNNERVSDVAGSEASRRNAKERTEPHLKGQSPKEAHGPAAQEAARYRPDVPVPTNNAAAGDQSVNR